MRSADPQRRPARPMRRGSQHAALHFPQAVPIDRLAAPERAAKAQALEQAPDTLLERHTCSREFRPDVRHVGGNADTEDQPPLGDLVERGHLMRQQHGVAQRRQQHGGAEFEASHARSHGGEQRQRLVPRPRQQGIADPDRVEAQALRALRQRQQRRGLRLSGHDLLASRQQVSQTRCHGVLPVTLPGLALQTAGIVIAVGYSVRRLLMAAASVPSSR